MVKKSEAKTTIFGEATVSYKYKQKCGVMDMGLSYTSSGSQNSTVVCKGHV